MLSNELPHISKRRASTFTNEKLIHPVCFLYQSLYTTVYQSSAKLLQGTAALTSIVFGQVPAVTSNWH